MTPLTFSSLVNRLADKRRLTVFVIEVCLLVLHYFLSSIELATLAFPIGIVCYIFIPGFLLVSNLRFLSSNSDIITDLLFGFSLPVVIICIFWGLHIEPVNFRIIIPILMSLLVFLMAFAAPTDFTSRFRRNYLTKSIFIVLILAIAVRACYFYFNSSSIAIDGGLYSDTARTIITQGEFSSKVLNSNPSIPYFEFEGFMPYPLTIFSVASFFLIGGVSFIATKLATVFIGLLVVLMIYKLASEIFGQKTALMAGLISALFPLLSYYSAILFGPEILSTLFVLASTYFFMLGIKSSSKISIMVLSGLFAALAFGAWGLIPFFTLLVSLTIAFIVYHFRKGIILILYAFFTLGVVFLVYKLSAVLSLEVLLLAVFIPFVFLLWKKGTTPNLLKITVFVSAAILSLQLLFVYSYLSPHPYITGMEHVIVPLPDTLMNNPLNSLNPFSLPFGINTDISYIINSFGRFWESLAIIFGSFLFVLFLIAFISPSKFKEKIMLLIFPFVSASIFVLTFTSGNVLGDRFLVLPSCFLIILSSKAIITILDSNASITRSFRVLLKNKVLIRMKNFRPNNVFWGITLLIIVITLIPIHSNYLNNFDTGYLNLTNWYGEAPLDWIRNSTNSTDVFCAADSNRLAFFTNRVFVDSAVTSGKFDVPALANLITEFKINYVVVDAFFINYRSHSSFFDGLYKNTMSLGQETPLLEENFVDTAISSIISSKNSTYDVASYGLKLTYQNSNQSRTIRIFQVVDYSYSFNIKFLDSSFANNWSPSRGNLTIDSQGVVVSTTKPNDWAYIFLNNSQTLPNLTSDSFLAVKVRGNNNNNNGKFGISFVDPTSNWYKVAEDTSGPVEFQVYNYNLGKIADKNIANLYLCVSGSNVTSVTYNWVAIYDIVTKGR